MKKSAEKMFLKITKVLGEEKQDLLLSVEVNPDDSYKLKKVIFWEQNQETGKEAWAVMPLGLNPEYEDGMKSDITAEIKRARSTNETQNPEYQRLLRYTRKKWIFQDY